MTFSNSFFAMNKGALLQWGVGSPSEMSENQKKIEGAASKLYHEEASRKSNT